MNKRDYDKRWYANRTPEQKAEKVRRATERKHQLRTQVFEYLKTHPCIDCGETDPIVLEFDHIHDTKTSNIADMVGQGTGFAKILTEIAKCEVRCANCHRRRTAKGGSLDSDSRQCWFESSRPDFIMTHNNHADIIRQWFYRAGFTKEQLLKLPGAWTIIYQAAAYCVLVNNPSRASKCHQYTGEALISIAEALHYERTQPIFPQ